MTNSEHIAYRMVSGTAEKLLFFCMGMLIVLTCSRWSIQLFILVGGVTSVVRAVYKRSLSWRLLLLAISFVVLGSLVLMLVVGHKNIDAWWQIECFGLWWSITYNSFWYALQLACRAVNSILFIQLLSVNISLAEAITTARKLKVPNSLLELVLLSYRYLFVLKETAHVVRLAQNQRLGYISFRNSLRSTGLLLSMVFIKSLRFSMQNFQSMQVRGYGGFTHQSEEWHPSSFLGILLITVSAIILFCVEFFKF
ncbi:energy-coupling factor transporter transmembrane component T [Carboxylicivirga sp. M1479]|uniref:energy-coupling factor transporter transmembrane component T n=1 Tax=Carboxylicivirga sp. M1479 TaxID=2594476 RepID=UPI0011774C0E|nr:energy-coupling factor transporter transmembrane component T [Carboxylicivirga sp. M1479]TRX70226.1 hypothetical protein FNN09_12125 [Carboxylicivirga sp. M1479]